MIRKVLIAGGGTGGHLFPGLAVVEEFRRRTSSVEFLFVGTQRGIEARILPERGENVRFVSVAPLKGKRGRALAQAASALPKASLESSRILREFRPDLVLGVGGYAAGPMVATAALMRIPTAILEQNAHVGLTNRLLARMVGRAYLSFDETVAHFPRDTVRVTGNPVRRAFVEAARRASVDPDGFEARTSHVLVVGGSQGAEALNRSLPDLLQKAGIRGSGLKVLHQSGERMRAEVEAAYRHAGIEAEVVSFIEDMESA
ncbi:MAG: UDP-N-acetylglucosamine--N-acetylmuramyl-(pentapeptide) pyrophosphoryl-undecaprenol N-acetylglucosamine transferase, partial [Myxococcales bacterium]|nr:UDP-N-acetylglucosamine--N-acetylmuramyl-(pentapeptide) pyrophosphoryl-undecaprenol N-acetylglucosamine transferase [Myxococcales bacterium]